VKRRLIALGIMVVFATALWAAQFKHLKLVSGTASGDLSSYDNEGVVQLTIDTGADTSYGSIETEALDVTDAKYLFGFVRLNRIDGQVGDSSIIQVKLYTTMSRSGGIKKLLDSSQLNDTGQITYVLGEDLDTLLWKEVYFVVEAVDTTDDSANFGADPKYHFQFELGKR